MQRRFVRLPVRIACAGQAGKNLCFVGLEKKYLPVKELLFWVLTRHPRIITVLASAGAFYTYPRPSRVSQYDQGSFKGRSITNKCFLGMIAGWRKYQPRDSENSH